jgi:conjugal transfer ATP-binding protein TraC
MSEKIIIYAEENVIVGANGTMAIGYSLELPEKYSLSKEDYVTLNDSWNRGLKDLPSNSIFFKQDVFLKEEYSTGNYPDENFLQQKTKEYFSGREFLNHKCFVFFILPDMETFNSKITNPFKKYNRKAFEKFDEKQKNFMVSVEQAVNYLTNIKINSGNAFKFSTLSTELLNNYYDYYFNNFQSDYITDRHIENGYLKIGDRYLGAVAMVDEEKMPEKFRETKADKNFSNAKYKFFQNYGDEFGFDLNFDHIYNQIIFLDDNQNHLDKIRKQNDLLKKSSSFDPQNKVNAEKTGKLIKELSNDLDLTRIVRGHFNVLVYGDSIKEVISRRDLVFGKFKEIDVKAWKPTSNFLNSVYCNSFFLNTQYMSEQQLFYNNLLMASIFINNCTNYKDDASGITMNSRIGNVPVKVDMWDEKKKYIRARNFMILAPTGYGKSFFANHLFRQYYEEGSKLVIVDLGGSYRKLMALYPDDTAFIHYKEGEQLGINPFDLEKENDLTAMKIDDLVEFILVHYKRGSNTKESEKTSLRKLIQIFYRKEAERSLTKFVFFLEKNKDTILQEADIQDVYFNLDEFLFLMSEFMEGGLYESLYKDEGNETLSQLKDKKIIVFELDEAKDNELILSIMLILISSTVNEVVWKDKSTRGYVFFDEFAKQLKFPGVLEKIEYFFQAIRKQTGSVGIVLQSISQLPENSVATSIIENTQIVCVINAKDFNQIQNRFGMSQHAYNQMVSVSSKFEGKYPYSEIFLMRGNHHQVYRLEVPKEVFWAYQTEGAMNDILLNIFDEVKDMVLAINIMVKDQFKFNEIKNEIESQKINKEEALLRVKRIIQNN